MPTTTTLPGDCAPPRPVYSRSQVSRRGVKESAGVGADDGDTAPKTIEIPINKEPSTSAAADGTALSKLPATPSASPSCRVRIEP